MTALPRGRWTRCVRAAPASDNGACGARPYPGSPKAMECGHGDERVAAGLEYPANLAERPIVLIDVLDNVGRKDEVEALVCIREGACIAEIDRPQPLRLAKANGDSAAIEPYRARKPQFLQQAKIGAGAGSDV